MENVVNVTKLKERADKYNVELGDFEHFEVVDYPEGKVKRKIIYYSNIENDETVDENKSETKIMDKSISINRTNLDENSINNQSIIKIKIKKKKLELLKKRQEDYLKLVAIQKKRRKKSYASCCRYF